jgi:uncharacterized protein YndB with AHSA1/START domain
MNAYGVIVGPGTVRFERLLPGPIERVWSYLTDSEKRGTWLAKGNMDLRIDGNLEFEFCNSKLTGHDETAPAKFARFDVERRMTGRVVACDPPRLLTYTWGENFGQSSEVTFELAPRGDKVLLTLTHRRLGTRDTMVSVGGGWHTHLDILADRLEERKPPAFWATYLRREAEYEERIPTN